MATDWNTIIKPGNGYEYNQKDMTYNQSVYEGFIVYYNSLGLSTAWNEESKPSTDWSGTSKPSSTSWDAVSKP